MTFYKTIYHILTTFRCYNVPACRDDAWRNLFDIMPVNLVTRFVGYELNSILIGHVTKIRVITQRQRKKRDERKDDQKLADVEVRKAVGLVSEKAPERDRC